MFSTCIHCHASLGKNESIEHFPVGERLAFDSAKGRLWVVCMKCRRWNLTPLEERWEAIEECERQFEGTTLRASTDNIGLAKLRSGMELVRVGSPLRPEIASWRYAGNFRRRWLMYGAPLAAVTGFMSVLQFSANAVSFPIAIGSMLTVGSAAYAWKYRAERTNVLLPSGRTKKLPGSVLGRVHLRPVGRDWGITGLPEDTGEPLTGPLAVHNLRAITTVRNFKGARSGVVTQAVDLLATSGDSSQFIARLARASERTGVHDYSDDVALALEMALHEDVERRALEGELAALQLEWTVAEEIANVADDMMIPSSVMDDLSRLRTGE